MKDVLERPKGTVHLTFSTATSNKEEVVENAVVSNAKKLIARALGGDSNYLINTIEIWEQGVLIAADTITVTYPTVETVKFTGIFLETAFSGHFDQIVLKNNNNGIFSEILGLDFNKDSDEKLAIGWEIKPQ